MLKHLTKFQVALFHAKDERGATAVEYGLLVSLIAVAIIVVVTLLGTSLSDKFQSVVDAI